MIIFPDISPVAFSIGSFGVHWYGLGYMAGILLGWAFARKLVVNKKIWQAEPPIKTKHIDDLVTWVLCGIIFGGRLGYVLFYNFNFYLQNPLDIFALWDGGMSFHGGAIGSLIAVVTFARRNNIKVYSLLDIACASSCFGLFLVRIANFINSELWGITSNVAWAVLFPNGGGQPRHPSQLYEAFLEGIVLFIVLSILIFKYKKLQRPGFICGMWIFLYATFRIIVEFVREPDEHIGYLFGNFVTAGMVLCLPMLLAGLYLIKNARDKKL